MATTAEIEAELALLKEDRTKVRAAIRAVLEGGQSYTLDTSQSRQTVSKANLTELRGLYDWLTKEISQLESDLDDGGGATRIIPGY